MKFAKRLALALVLIIAAILILAAFVDKKYSVEREIEIEKPVAAVFDYIRLLKNQNEYSVWATRDPDMKKEYRGTDGEPGFVSSWDSEDKNVGRGEQEIIRVKPNERIDFELRFFAPMQAVEPAYMATESLGEGGTRVIWGFKGHFDYPFNLMLLFMDMEEIIGGDLQKGLNNLKAILEKTDAVILDEDVMGGDGDGGLGEELSSEEDVPVEQDSPH